MCAAFSRVLVIDCPGTRRPDIPWIERALDPEFFAYVRSFNREVCPRMLRELADARSTPLTVFYTRAEADAYLRLQEQRTPRT